MPEPISFPGSRTSLLRLAADARAVLAERWGCPPAEVHARHQCLAAGCAVFVGRHAGTGRRGTVKLPLTVAPTPPARRRARPLRAFDGAKADRFLATLRAGDGWAAALQRSALNERIVYAWLAHAGRAGDAPELEPYRTFRAAMLELVIPPGLS